MEFYKAIADYYDEIFPLKPPAVEFVKTFISGGSKKTHLLDVGCATGSLALALKGSFGNVTGIDRDKQLLDIAVEKKEATKKDVSFILLDMLSMNSFFANTKFDIITCFGNTLAHLNGMNEIQLFFRQCMSLLPEKGTLLIQIIHYDRILNKNIRALPDIDTKNIRFERIYSYSEGSNKICFEATLTVKNKDVQLIQQVLLYPFTQSELKIAAREAGFSRVIFYSDYNKTPLQPDHLSLIAVLNK